MTRRVKDYEKPAGDWLYWRQQGLLDEEVKMTRPQVPREVRQVWEADRNRLQKPPSAKLHRKSLLESMIAAAMMIAHRVYELEPEHAAVMVDEAAYQAIVRFTRSVQ
jgi:hypothetical protein